MDICSKQALEKFQNVPEDKIDIDGIQQVALRLKVIGQKREELKYYPSCGHLLLAGNTERPHNFSDSTHVMRHNRNCSQNQEKTS